MSQPVSRFYFANRLRLHYVEWGQPDRPTLLLVHGGRDHCRSWDWVVQHLANDFHILAPDLRGHGDSGWATGSGYTLTDVVGDLVQLLRQRADGRAYVMGHSFGGAATMMLAGLYPELVERLVVVEGTWQWSQLQRGIGVHERFREWEKTVHELSARAPRKYPSLEEATARMQAENRRLTLEQAHHLTLHGMHQNEDGSYSWKFDNYVRAPYPPQIGVEELTSIWSSITCPTLLIGGGQSWLPADANEAALGLLPQGKLAMIPEAGHWPHHDFLAEFIDHTRPFLLTGR